ncbi:hypothetical protein J3F83DRAFT_409418 [Trichoderma novae-zelandiae]
MPAFFDGDSWSLSVRVRSQSPETKEAKGGRRRKPGASACWGFGFVPRPVLLRCSLQARAIFPPDVPWKWLRHMMDRLRQDQVPSTWEEPRIRRPMSRRCPAPVKSRSGAAWVTGRNLPLSLACCQPTATDLLKATARGSKGARQQPERRVQRRYRIHALCRPNPHSACQTDDLRFAQALDHVPAAACWINGQQHVLNNWPARICHRLRAWTLVVLRVSV